MTAAAAPYSAYDLLVDFGSITFNEPFSLERFTAFCERYPDMIAERDAAGKVHVMSPVKFGSGANEGHLFGYVYSWNLTNGKPGYALSPSTGFLLANEEIRCGDAVWVSNERLSPFLKDPDYLTRWVDAVPDFVVEVKSESDRITALQRKMTDTWLANGVRLGWLIDPEREIAYVYRSGQSEPEEFTDFDQDTLSGEDVLPGFTFPLSELNV